MDKKSKYYQLPTEGDLPPGIPSADEGWSGMQEKLAQQLPVLPTAETGTINRKGRKRYLLLLLLVMLLAGAWFSVGYFMNSSRTVGTDAYVPSSQAASDPQELPAGNADPEHPTNLSKHEEMNIGDSVVSSNKSHSPVNSSATNNPNKKEINQAGHSIPSIGTARQMRPPSRTTRKRVIAKALSQHSTNKTKQSAHKPALEEEAIEKQQHSSSAPENASDSKNSAGAATDTIASKMDAEKNKDSAIAIATSSTKDEPPAGWIFSGGLQWTIQLPTYSTGDYFTGSSARNQAYRVFIPGIWMRAKVERSAIVAEINPFFSNLVPSKTFKTSVSSSNLPDSVVITTENKSLRKTFGISTGFEYQYNVRTQWWIGGGVQGYFLTNAVALAERSEERRALNGSGSVFHQSSDTYKIPRNEWSSFSKTHFALSGQLFYLAPKWQAGLRFALPVTSLSKQSGPKYPLRTEFLFRWTLYDQKK